MVFSFSAWQPHNLNHCVDLGADISASKLSIKVPSFPSSSELCGEIRLV
jgi:hypothetical protein